jgi:hypothetical protein
MKPWTTWLARLGIAGACFIVTGCGGGDVPDASSDGQAATESASGGARPAPAANAGAKIAANDDQAAKADEPAAEPSAPAQAQEPEPPPANAKTQESKGNSKTAEMLAMATGPSGGSNPPADGSAPPADGSTSPPGGSGANSSPGGPAAPGAQGGSPPAGQGASGPGQAGRPGMGQQGQQGQGQQGQAARRGMADLAARAQQQNQGNQQAAARSGQAGPGGPGGPGAANGAGAAGVDNTPADFHSPIGAVRAFMSALKAKDLDRLNEATALRAQVEASTKNQALFKKIFDLSLSDSDLDELAKKLEGYQIAFENPAQSTARIDVILQKQDQNSNGGYFRRKVTVRHEKKGWGVLDIAGAQEFKALNAMPRSGASGKRG